VLGERRVVVPLAIGGGISDAHTANDAATMPACARREERRRRQLPARLREPSLKRKGDPEGESGSPSGLLVSRFEVGARGDYAARTDLPRSLAMAWRSICRTRSAVMPQIAPISASFA
jgi:hypothetical protein